MITTNLLKQAKYYALSLLFIIVFEICTGFVRAYDTKIDNIVMFIKCFLITLLVLSKMKKYFIPYFISLHVFYGTLIIIFLIGYLFYNEMIITTWTNCILGLLGGWAALLFYNSKNKTTKYIIIGTSGVMLSIFMINYRFINYFISFKSFKFINGQYIDPSKYSITNDKNEQLKFSKEKIYILDFWTTTCAVCFKQFPSFDKKLKQNTNSNVKYISVNRPFEMDTVTQAFDVMKKYNYSFPVFKGSSLIDVAFGIEGYPTIVALRNDTILYKGNLERLDDFLETIQ